MTTLYIVALSFLSGLLYRIGGAHGYHTVYRDMGVSICVCAALALLGYFHWSLVACFGLMWGSLTTYFGFVNPWISKPKSTKYWWNWFLVGLAISLAIMPIVIVYDLWTGFFIRTLVCTALITLWSELISNVVWEENGRGFITVATLPLLLIG